MTENRFLSTHQAAEQLGVHPQTLRRWERAGTVAPATRRLGRRVYTSADVDRIKAAVFSPPPSREVLGS